MPRRWLMRMYARSLRPDSFVPREDMGCPLSCCCCGLYDHLRIFMWIHITCTKSMQVDYLFVGSAHLIKRKSRKFTSFQNSCWGQIKISYLPGVYLIKGTHKESTSFTFNNCISKNACPIELSIFATLSVS